MTTLVFGGSGFIGRRLVELLRAEGDDVVCADISPPAVSEQGASSEPFVACDLRRFDEVISTMSEVRPRRAVNLAYMMNSERPPHVALQLNVIGMDNFFEAARLTQVEHTVFTSSLAVNGKQTHFGERRVTEDDLLLGTDYQYATHKVFNEMQAEDYRQKHGMRITSVRPANVAGHDKVFGSVDHVRCMTGPALGEPVSFPYADAMRSPVHVNDVAIALARITLAEPRHTAYNTGGNATSLGELADVVRSLVPGAEIEFEHESGGRDGSTNYLIDNSRLRDEFGIAPMELRDCVARIVEDTRAAAGVTSVAQS